MEHLAIRVVIVDMRVRLSQHGILLGRLSSMAVRSTLHWPTQVSWPAMFAAVGVSLVIGVVFGYYPAWKASQLDPIEALRYE